MEMIIKENHIIDDVEWVIGRLKEFLQENIQLEEIKNFVLTEQNTIFYFKKDLTKTEENDKNAKLAWIDTGYYYKSEPIFLSLLKEGTEYVGHFVGTASFLVNGLIDHYGGKNMYISKLKKFLQKYKEKILQKRTIPHLMKKEQFLLEPKKETESVAYFGTEMEKKLLDLGYKISDEAKIESQIAVVVQKQISSVTEEIYEQLLYLNWKSMEGLDRYIKVSGCRIKQLVEQGKKEYFVINNIRSVVINTGLLDRFGADCYVLYRYHEKYKTYIPDMLIRSKADYTNNGFTKEDANRAVDLKPIQFVDAPMYFEATMKDFDINQKCLLHIIEERRKRFPNDVQEESADFLFKKIQEALERGLKMQMRDHSYAKLTYSGKDGELSWLLPLHIQRDFTKEPELVMAIRKQGEYYEVKTILPYDEELKDKITAMELYGKLW